MHIPDGFLSTEVAAATAVVSAGALGYSLRRADELLDDRRVPLVGVTGAFIFAAQMLNFPVAGGTSGHLLGAALAAILLGPWIACLVMAVVLTTQAFVFADGGDHRAGGEHPQHGRDRRARRRRADARHARACCPSRAARSSAIAGAGAWLAVMVGAAATALELGDLGHRAARDRAAGDARRPRADRHRRGGDHRRGASAPCSATRPDLVAVADLRPAEIRAPAAAPRAVAS